MEVLLSQPWTILPPPHPWRLRLRFPHSSPSSSSSSRFCVCFSTKYRPWDSNAETIRSKKFNYKFTGEDEEEDTRGPRWWWSDESSAEWEEEEEDEEPAGIFEQVIDAFWIFKVFRSYGWALPPIIMSLLLSTGPKAFLMALALPLAQSVFSLAFDQLQKMTETRPKRRSRTKKKKPFTRPASKAASKGKKKKTGGGYSYDYQSWVAGNSDSDNKGGNGTPNFGGWGDDLDGVRSVRSKTVDRGKLSMKRRDRKSGTPLLLRLLIAVFPFLGSWTRML